MGKALEINYTMNPCKWNIFKDLAFNKFCSYDLRNDLQNFFYLKNETCLGISSTDITNNNFSIHIIILILCWRQITYINIPNVPILFYTKNNFHYMLITKIRFLIKFGKMFYPIYTHSHVGVDVFAPLPLFIPHIHHDSNHKELEIAQ